MVLVESIISSREIWNGIVNTKYFSECRWCNIRMAKSKYEYVKNFELSDAVLPNCWMVVRIDGRSFHKFSDEHKFEKPNDIRALNLMNKCAEAVFREFQDIIFAIGESDEYSFVIHKDSTLFTRRSSKIVSCITSYFASNYVFYWSSCFPNEKLQRYPPTFDGRLVCYPAIQNLRDYLSWRQVDCHINNMYNTCFWTLVKSGKTPKEAEDQLKGTLSEHKNELLFSQFGINYNNLPQMFRKGSILYKKEVDETTLDTRTNEQVIRKKKRVVVEHEDIISDDFWKKYSYILK